MVKILWRQPQPLGRDISKVSRAGADTVCAMCVSCFMGGWDEVYEDFPLGVVSMFLTVRIAMCVAVTGSSDSLLVSFFDPINASSQRCSTCDRMPLGKA